MVLTLNIILLIYFILFWLFLFICDFKFVISFHPLQIFSIQKRLFLLPSLSKKLPLNRCFYFNHENHKSRWMWDCPFLFPLLDHSMPKYISIYMINGRLEEFFFFLGYQTKRLHHIIKFGVSLAIILTRFLLSANTESEVLKKNKAKSHF